MSTTFTLVPDYRPGSHLGSAFSPRVVVGPVPWLPWVDSNPIATAAREDEFVRTLVEESGGQPASHSRADVTALLNALRGGLTVATLRATCPGVRPDRLYSAYQALEARRAESAGAWAAIIEQPTLESLDEYGDVAACLVPVLVNRLRETASIDAQMLHRVSAHLAAEVDQVRRLVRNSELEIDRQPDSSVAIDISRTLYDPMSDCLFARSDYLPDRVGSLVPTRVAALLHERDVTLPARAAS